MICTDIIEFITIDKTLPVLAVLQTQKNTELT